MYNPSLREEPRHKPAPVIPTKQQSSILDWLESTGRLMPREGVIFDEYADDSEDLQEIMLDEGTYDDLDEEEDDLMEEEDGDL